MLALILAAQVPAPPPPAPRSEEEQARSILETTAVAPAPTTPDDAIIDGRRRPGFNLPLPDRVTQENQGAIRAPAPEAFPPDSYDYAVPDRWRLMKTLCGTLGRSERARGCADRRPFDARPLSSERTERRSSAVHRDREEQEHRKAAGIPRCLTPGFLHHEDWFLALSAISDTVVEPRSFPIPVGVQTTGRPGSLDVFGRSHSLVVSQTFIAGSTCSRDRPRTSRPKSNIRFSSPTT